MAHHRVRGFWALGATLVASLTLGAWVPARASAQDAEVAENAAQTANPGVQHPGSIDTVRIDVHGGVGWRAEIGGGARLEFALVRDGFIPKIRDQFGMSVGGDLMLISREREIPRFDNQKPFERNYSIDDRELHFPVALQWNFLIGDKWSVFPEAGINMHMTHHLYTHFYAGAGARWHFSDSVALVLRATNQKLFHLGLTFP